MDPRSDVFSTGIVLYEMLSGVRPFQGSSNSEIVRALLSTDPAPLSSIAPDVPGALAQIVQRCLQKNPEARYRDAVEVGAQLHALDGDSLPRAPFGLSTVAATIQTLVPNLMRKHRRRLAAGVFALLLATLVAGYLWLPAGKDAAPSDAAPVALLPAEALQRAQAYLQRYDRKGNVDRAIATLESALQSDNFSPSLHAALAEAYVRKYGETSDKRWLQMAVESGKQGGRG